MSSDLSKIADQMKKDWNRRVTHDYRFWMSDGHTDDSAMWESGERDLSILLEGAPTGPQLTCLDVGCGVGRLLGPARRHFGRVIGVDISEAAIAKVHELLGDSVEGVAGNGLDLRPVADQSVDVVLSFAALVCMPAVVVAGYLREFYRVLRPGGMVRIQLYVGTERSVALTDTLQLRCYREECLRGAAEAAGFGVEWIRDLVLPLQVSFDDLGLGAKIISLRKTGDRCADLTAVASALLPGGEPFTAIDGTSSSDLEYWVSLNYAKELADAGDPQRAREALEYAVSFAKTTTIDVQDLLERIVATIEQQQPPAVDPAWSAEVFDRNMQVIRERFPGLEQQLVAGAGTGLQLKSTADGMIIIDRGQALDHETKPRSAGEVWSRRLLQEERARTARSLVVAGFGTGWHLEALLGMTSQPVSVIEPNPGVLRLALGARDLRPMLSRIEQLVLGDPPDGFFDEHAELLVRPQTLALEGVWCGRVKARFYGERGLTSLHPTVAVLGPIQGGSLPITGYTIRALHGLHQRVREWDVSGFAAGYHYVENFVKDRMRQGSVQGLYLEMISQTLLEAVNEKKIDVLICMAQAPISGRILTELRNRGVVTVLWFMEDYLRFGYWKDLARFYDFVFTIQRGECLELMRAAGAGEVHYLPMACDPGIHTPVQLSPEERARWGSPVSFVGAGYHNRQQVFASLADLPFKIWGTEWPGCRPFDRMVQEEGRRLTPVEYNRIFNATDININLHSSSERDGVDPRGDFVNPRTFELAAAGAFQLVDERSLLTECFEPGKELVTFGSPAELKELIHYYRDRPDERQRIAAAGRARALRDHSYAGRIREMLSIIYSSKFEQLKRREDASPWRGVLERSRRHPELHSRCQAAFERGEEPNLDGLVSDIISGQGKLTDTEQKLLFLYHIRKQIIRMKAEEAGLNK